jgi:hypothetical protein
MPTELGQGLVYVLQFSEFGQAYKEVKIKGPTKVGL